MKGNTAIRRLGCEFVTFVRDQQFECASGMFGNVFGDCPAPAGELEQAVPRRCVFPKPVSLFSSRFKPAFIDQFIAADLKRIAKSAFVAKIIRWMSPLKVTLPASRSEWASRIFGQHRASMASPFSSGRICASPCAIQRLSKRCFLPHVPSPRHILPRYAPSPPLLFAQFPSL